MRPITLTIDAPFPIRHDDGKCADQSSPNAIPLFRAAAAVVAADPDAFPIRHPVHLVITSSEPVPDLWREHGYSADSAIVDVFVDAEGKERVEAVGHSQRGNPKVNVCVVTKGRTRWNSATNRYEPFNDVETVMLHDLVPWEEHEREVAAEVARRADEQRRHEERLARDLDIVARRGDDTAFVVKSDYRYSLADITGPYDWSAEQRQAVDQALASLDAEYDLPYENHWRMYTGGELRARLPELHGEASINELIDDRVIAPFLPVEDNA